MLSPPSTATPVALILASLLSLAWGLDHVKFGASRVIQPNPCVHDRTGEEGVCMFAWDCLNLNGTHITFCRDRFYYGSCCKLPDGVEAPNRGPPTVPSFPSNHLDSSSSTRRTPAPTTTSTVAAHRPVEIQFVDGETETARPPVVEVQFPRDPKPRPTIPPAVPTRYPIVPPTTQRRPIVVNNHHKKPGYPVVGSTLTSTPRPRPTEEVTTMAITDVPTGNPTWIIADEADKHGHPTMATSDSSPTTAGGRPEPDSTLPSTDASGTRQGASTAWTTEPPATVTDGTNTATESLADSSYTEKTTEEQKVDAETTTHASWPEVSTREPAGVEGFPEDYEMADSSPTDPPHEENAIDVTTEAEMTTRFFSTRYPIRFPPKDRPTTTTTTTTMPEEAENATTEDLPESQPSAGDEEVAAEDNEVEAETKQPAEDSASSTQRTTTEEEEGRTDEATPTQPPTSTTVFAVPEETPTMTTVAATSAPTTTEATTVRPSTTSASHGDEAQTEFEPQSTSAASDQDPTSTTETVQPAEDDTVPPATSTTPTTSPAASTSSTADADHETTEEASETSTSSALPTGMPVEDETPSTAVPQESTAGSTTPTAAPTTELVTTLASSTTSASTSAPSTTTPPTTTTPAPTEVPTSTSAQASDQDEEGRPATASDVQTETVSSENPTTEFTTAETTTTAEYDPVKAICGRPKTFATARIVGGDVTRFGKWPWMISLRQFKKNTFVHKCGAALLNEYWAVSAAHCVHNVSPNDILLRLGEYDLSGRDNEPLAHLERRVQIVATHPKFDSHTFENDLALMRFYEPVSFTDNIVPICIADGNETYVGKTAVVTGWGRLYEDGPLPSVLQKVQVPIITNKECERMYRRAGFVEDIPDIFICAGLSSGGKDSCEGDSGGPLVLRDEDSGAWNLIGIISWGIGCALPNQPGVYTRITNFADWMKQIIVF